MNSDTPLAILATLAFSKKGLPSISFLRCCKKGNCSGHIITFNFHIDSDGNFAMSKADARKTLSSLQKRRIHHHGQPEIIDMINSVLIFHDLKILNNQTFCTKALLDNTDTCTYDTNLDELATRSSIAESLILGARYDSSTMCSVYFQVFNKYIRHIREDVFGTHESTPTDWFSSLSETERQIIKDGPEEAQLPDNWTLLEAQSLWLMVRAGETIPNLALMLGRPDHEIEGICNLFRAQHRTAA